MYLISDRQLIWDERNNCTCTALYHRNDDRYSIKDRYEFRKPNRRKYRQSSFNNHNNHYSQVWNSLVNSIAFFSEHDSVHATVSSAMSESDLWNNASASLDITIIIPDNPTLSHYRNSKKQIIIKQLSVLANIQWHE